MSRRLINLLTALSLLLCVAALAEWLRSATAIDHPISWSSSPYDRYGIVTGRGQLGFMYGKDVSPVVQAPAGATADEVASWSRQFGSDSNRQLLGFAVVRRLNMGRTKDGGAYYAGWERGVALPYWSLVLATALLPALWGVRYSRRRKARRAAGQGRCQRCGYDLRATPGKCPECGGGRGE